MNQLNHVAIIMDGNGRWGLKNRKSRSAGHKEGLKIVEKILKESIRHNIKFLTLYAFSTENWKRPKKEVDYLFNLLTIFIEKNLDTICKKNIKLKFIGSKNFSKKIKKIINFSEKKTINNDKIQITIALNYGSKSELLNAFKKLKKSNVKVNEKNLSKNLQTNQIPDPDLLIRTGNTKRLSNFLLWQLAYSEIYFEKKLWPDFSISDFNRIINNYKNIKRKFGNI